MATGSRSTAVGVFATPRQARQAIHELRLSGFTEEQVGVAARDADELPGAADRLGKDTHAAEGAAAGALAGAGVGGAWALGIAAGILPALGPVIAGGLLASVLASVAGGAAVGGLAGALVGLGFPEEEARFYEDEIKAERAVVIVKAGDRYAEASAILRSHGGYDAAHPAGSTM
jgi:hypothetical protein